MLASALLTSEVINRSTYRRGRGWVRFERVLSRFIPRFLLNPVLVVGGAHLFVYVQCTVHSAVCLRGHQTTTDFRLKHAHSLSVQVEVHDTGYYKCRSSPLVGDTSTNKRLYLGRVLASPYIPVLQNTMKCNEIRAAMQRQLYTYSGRSLSPTCG